MLRVRGLSETWGSDWGEGRPLADGRTPLSAGVALEKGKAQLLLMARQLKDRGEDLRMQEREQRQLHERLRQRLVERAARLGELVSEFEVLQRGTALALQELQERLNSTTALPNFPIAEEEPVLSDCAVAALRSARRALSLTTRNLEVRNVPTPFLNSLSPRDPPTLPCEHCRLSLFRARLRGALWKVRVSSLSPL